MQSKATGIILRESATASDWRVVTAWLDHEAKTRSKIRRIEAILETCRSNRRSRGDQKGQ